MIIRRALPSDVSKLFALEQELFTAENFPLSRGSFSYHVKNNLLYVAEIDGKIAGYILALVKRTKAKVYSIGVSHAFRGKKIASKLLKIIMTELNSMNFKQIVLEVRTDNKAAIALYLNFGFEIKKTVPFFYRDGRDAYIMEFGNTGKTPQRL
ncbi:ribosomal protein S18-alanine N-acetyltransferase [bacterium]|nr:ribosomal protein S18-alanine N-acetyltransferase [bacterium]MBU1434856.1 ribosomal protein S18-alanine N-acetyltransferase [bacterium]MBU1503961.1 ribosomal protein S18-alanine N-acetyltransferase [bacterium]